MLRWRRAWLPWCGTLPFLKMFLFVGSVLSHYITISFTREELLDIRQHTPDIFSSFFVYSDALFDVLVRRGSSPSQTHTQTEKREAPVKLRESGFRTALSSIHLANLWSLPNKTDELLLLTCTNKDFFKLFFALCFTETWLSEAIPDNVLPFPGYQLFRADCITELNNGEKEMWWIMFLHKGRLVFRRNNSEEDLLS